MDDMKNPNVINLQLALLKKKELKELVGNKKKNKSFFKIAILIFFLVVIASLIGISTNKDSQGTVDAAAFFRELWLSERDYG